MKVQIPSFGGIFCYDKGMKMIVGIDEVGRGPIAGPVCVGAFVWKQDMRNFQISISNFQKINKLKLRDSKKLSKTHREAWFEIIKVWQKQGLCDFAVSYVSASTLDRIGIAPAISRALTQSIEKVSVIYEARVLLDGGLRAPKEFKNQKTIIKGDEKEPVIAFASIVAKVSRDRLMMHHSKKFPQYGFDRHVGYGTKEHYRAVKKHGITPLHRRSFLKGIVREKN